MKQARRAIPWMMAVLAAGCVTAPAGGPKPAGPLLTRPASKASPAATVPATGSFISNGGASLVSNNSAGLSGTLMGPKAGLIANHGAGILSNNASGVVGNNGSNLRVLAVADLLAPAAGASVTVVDEGGRPLSDAPVTSGTDGSFKVEGLKPSGPVVFVTATYTQDGRAVTLMAAVPAPRDKAAPFQVDPSTTLVAKKLREMVRLGTAASQDFKPEGLKALAEAVAPAFDEKLAVAAAILTDTTATKVFDTLVTSKPEIGAAVSAAAGGTGLTALVAKTPDAPKPPEASASPSTAPASTAPSTAPSSSPSPVTSASPSPVTGGGVSTFAGNPAYKPADGANGQAAYNGPLGLAVDTAGNFYVADTDNHMIRKIAPNGTTTTLAGTGQPGYQDGPAAQAQFKQPTDVAVGADGTVYVADNENDCIRAIAPDGTVSTLAGDPDQQGFADGTGASARFSGPTGVAIAPDGHIYVADTGNHRIRHIEGNGAVTTVAGTGDTGKANGAAAIATFNRPVDMAFNATGLLVIADMGNGLVRSLSPAGQVSNYLATLYDKPHGVAFDTSGNLYVSEFGGHTIRKVTAAKQPSLLAGSTQGYFETVGSGAQFNSPAGLVVGTNGKLYVADALNHRIRSIDLGMIASVTSFAGGKTRYAEGQGTAALFNQPEALALAKDGTLYVADSGNYRLRAISPAGLVRTELGNIYGGSIGAASQLSFKDIKGLAFDTAGTLYITDSGDKSVRKLYFGTLQTVAGSGFSWPRGLTVAPDGTKYVVDGTAHRVLKVSANGAVSTFAGSSEGFAEGAGTAAQFKSPHSVVLDAEGNLIVADAGNHRIRKITPEGTVSTLAGAEAGSADGPAASARFRGPEGVAIAPDGAVIVADTGNHRLRRIAPDGTVSTLAGSTRGHADGSPAQARFSSPISVVVDAKGAIYVTDFGTHCIRKLVP